MKKLLNSFYAKISALFLVLLLLLGSVQIYIAYRTSRQFISEAEQKLNSDLASKMAAELQPQVEDGLDKQQIKSSIHYMMVFNPRIEIYLLDEQGSIRAFFAQPGKSVKAERVDLQPVYSFINASGDKLINGDDPRHPGTLKPFTAAPIDMGGQPGYVYIILESEQYSSALAMIQNSYILSAGFKTFLLAILATGIIGLILFGLLTRRLRRITASVIGFKEGDIDTRIDDDGNDELAELAQSFNAMADKIQRNIEKLRQNDIMRRELVANISHDLRTPLSSIQGYIETIQLKKDKLTAGQREKYLNIILKNTNLLSQLVRDLFELSKLEAKQIEPQFEPFYLGDLIQDIVMKLRPKAEEKSIKLVPSISGDNDQVMGDIALIERAVINLMDNAIRYTPDDGTIKIIAEEHDEHMRLMVSDTGCGIDDSELPFVFERFQRGEKSRTKTEDGSTGLGLAIAQKIVELHDSLIQVSSRLNLGTVFYFDLRKSGN